MEALENLNILINLFSKNRIKKLLVSDIFSKREINAKESLIVMSANPHSMQRIL